jgi:hypothetical protein
LDLDRWVLPAEFGQAGTHPRQGRFRSQAFTGRPGAGEQRLDLT